MKRIVILDLGYRSYQVERTLFAAQEYELALFSSPNEDIRAKIAFAQDAEGVLVRGTLLSESVLRQMPSVRAIVRYGVGYENIDLEAATRLGIRVANVQGYADHSVSDHALALILACARGLQPGLKQFPHRSSLGSAPLFIAHIAPPSPYHRTTGSNDLRGTVGTASGLQGNARVAEGALLRSGCGRHGRLSSLLPGL